MEESGSQALLPRRLETPNLKHQIPNKSEFSKVQSAKQFTVRFLSSFEVWDFAVVSGLEIRIRI
jgi:hypothetical protein